MPDDNFRQVLLQISAREGLVNPKFKSDSLTDTGYVGDVCTVDICSESGTLSLFFKCAQNNPALQEQILKYLFAAEINFYENLVPELLKLFGTAAQRCIPKCYYTSEDRLLVLENLYARKFKLWPDLKTELDEEHVRLVFEEYGRYHAMSHALKQRDPVEFERLLGKVDVLRGAYVRYKGLYRSITEKALAGFGEDLKECRLALDRFVNEEALRFLEEFDKDVLYDVAVHGDCWTHNYMFKYQDAKPVQVCLLDFQLNRRASPIVDLSYFMCTSACSKLHFDNLPEYLRIYSDSASSFLEENCHPCKDVLIGDELQVHWRKYGRYGLLWGMVVLKMMVADKDEIEGVDKEQGLFASFDFVSRNEELYVQKMKEAILYFFRNDML